MKTEFILLVIIGGFFSALIVFLIIIYKPAVPSSIYKTTTVSNESADSLKSRVKLLETELADSQAKQKEQAKNWQDFIFASTQSAKTDTLTGTKSIMAVTNTQGSGFTTTSAGYSPMGMYVNIKCLRNCYLWINFSTASKNLGPISSEQGNTNTYGLFIDNTDQGIYSQASVPVANASSPVSINSMISAGVGTHTIEIKAKTTGGTLQSDSSTLQVMAIEK